MKPPSRSRVKPARYLNKKNELKRQKKGLICSAWKRNEQRLLMMGLRRQSKDVGATREINCAALQSKIPKRSVQEVESIVEALKSHVVKVVLTNHTRQRNEQRRARVPIEVWTQLAGDMAGSLDEPIAFAFSQMLVICSTEPRSLRHSDPPKVAPIGLPTPTDGRTIPFRPMALSGSLVHLPKPPRRPTRDRVSQLKTPSSSTPSRADDAPVTPPASNPPRAPTSSEIPHGTSSVTTPSNQGATGPSAVSLTASVPGDLVTATAATVVTSGQPISAPSSPGVDTLNVSMSNCTISPVSSAPGGATASQASPSVLAKHCPSPASTCTTTTTTTSSLSSTSSLSTPTTSSASLSTTSSPIISSSTSTIISSPTPVISTAISSSASTIISSTTISSSTPTIISSTPTIISSSTTISSSTSTAISSSASAIISSSTPISSSSTTISSSTPTIISSSTTISSSTAISSSASAIISSSTPIISSSTSTTISSTPTPTTTSSTTTTSSSSSSSSSSSFFQNSRNAQEDFPRPMGLRCIVDFEKIYSYLSSAHRSDQENKLTSMESAVVLDLLLSLPEELPLLDCAGLERHMIQVYSRLTSPAYPKLVPSNLDAGASISAAMDSDGSQRVGTEPDGQAHSQSASTDNAFSQSRSSSQGTLDWEKAGICPLNPFMVPMQLLARQHRTQ